METWPIGTTEGTVKSPLLLEPATLRTDPEISAVRTVTSGNKTLYPRLKKCKV